MIKILFAIYLAFLLTQVFPFQVPLSSLALFVILAIVLFLLLSQAKIFRKQKKFSSRETILFLLIIGLALTIILFFSKIALLEKIPEKMQMLFVSDYSLFAWLAAPIIVLALITKKKSKKNKD